VCYVVQYTRGASTKVPHTAMLTETSARNAAYSSFPMRVFAAVTHRAAARAPRQSAAAGRWRRLTAFGPSGEGRHAS
jgi:hypothetical protein